jgi:predicted RNase H-like HicB family nuclease
MTFGVETEREDDGRWLAEITEIPGAMAYGDSEAEALSRAYAIALRAIADDLEEKKQAGKDMTVSFAGA